MSETEIAEDRELIEQVEEIEKRAERLEHIAEQQKELAEEEEEEARKLREEAERLREKGNCEHHKQHGVEITMVVNGAPVEIKAHETETLAQVRDKALEETENLGQPVENWEIKDEAGTLLDPNKTVHEYNFGEKVTLFLSLKAGAAGA